MHLAKLAKSVHLARKGEKFCLILRLALVEERPQTTLD